MKKTITSAMLMGLCVFVVGCDKPAGNRTMTTQEMAAKNGSTAGGAMDKASEMMDKGADLMGQAKDALGSVEGGSDMLKNVTDSFSSLTKLLGDVKDEASATSAVPEINKIADSFGGMTEMYGKLPDAAKGVVGKLFEKSLGDLKPIIDKILAIPGVESIIKPAIDALMSKLGAFKA
jgi:hypothetical protein